MAVDLSIERLRAAQKTQNIMPLAADARRLPFLDDAFDLCVCMDTLEHIPAADRDAVLTGIVSVIRPNGTAVVGFPSGATAEPAERCINAAYKRLTGTSFEWLDEHERMGLPDTDAVAERIADLAGRTHRVRKTKNASVLVWRGMWRIMMCGWPGRGNALFQALLRFLTPVLTRIHFGACYRTVIWIEPDKRDGH